MNKIVPGEADYKATLDTSGKVSGGVWFPGKNALAKIVCRKKWPDEVQHRLITLANPTGDITNSDIEMAAEVMGWLQWGLLR